MPHLQTLAEFLGVDDAAAAAPTELPQLTVADFCKGVLESREYRQSVLHRITLGTLPPAVELMMYARAYGAVPEKVEHTGKDGKPMEMITEVRRVVVRAPQFDDEAKDDDAKDDDAPRQESVH